jgi:hypothetical protein
MSRFNLHDWTIGPIQLGNWSVVIDLSPYSDPKNWTHTCFDHRLTCVNGELTVEPLAPEE